MVRSRSRQNQFLRRQRAQIRGPKCQSCGCQRLLAWQNRLKFTQEVTLAAAKMRSDVGFSSRDHICPLTTPALCTARRTIIWFCFSRFRSPQWRSCSVMLPPPRRAPYRSRECRLTSCGTRVLFTLCSSFFFAFLTVGFANSVQGENCLTRRTARPAPRRGRAGPWLRRLPGGRGGCRGSRPSRRGAPTGRRARRTRRGGRRGAR